MGCRTHQPPHVLQMNQTLDVHRMRQHHAIWRRVWRPFTLPESICTHQNSWIAYDAGCAGCTTCGCAHLCGVHVCESAQNTDGEEICCITGTWLGKLNLCNNEFVDSVYTPLTASSKPEGWALNKIGHNADSRQGDTTEFLEYQINAVPLHLICSPEWAACKASEVDRYAGKACDVLVKDLRVYKDMTVKGSASMPSIAEVLAGSIMTIYSLEQPVIISESRRKKICIECSAVIRKHIYYMAKMKSQLLSTPQKVRGVVVGLLYLMRQGIVHRGLVILPRMEHLSHLLPMEIYLESTFGTKSKVVTETENEVKRLIRCMTIQDLVDLNNSLYSK